MLAIIYHVSIKDLMMHLLKVNLVFVGADGVINEQTGEEMMLCACYVRERERDSKLEAVLGGCIPSHPPKAKS